MHSESKHVWKFFRVGGVDQVMFRDGTDLMSLGQLDQKLWMTLAVPTRGVEFDPKTADLIDTDKDGRIRPPELLAALHWVGKALKDPGDLIRGGDSVALTAIKDPSILAGAQRILANLGKTGAGAISLSEVSDTEKIFAETRFNGDSVITADTVDDAADKQALLDIIGVLGAVADRSGKPGLDKLKLDQFFAEAQMLSDWAAKGEADARLTPLGYEKTVRAAAAIAAVKTKVDDYFGRCRLASYDARAEAALNPEDKDYLAVAPKSLSISVQEVANLPLAKVAAGADLPLAGAVNPAWAVALAELATGAIAPLLGTSQAKLSEADWATAQAKVALFDAWMTSKPATGVAALGVARARELQKSGAWGRLSELIARDEALKAEFEQFAAVEKLVRFQKDLFKLTTNFVNFADFYGRKWALFQSGTLYLDNRSCNLCIEVADAGRHSTLAHLAGGYLAYCDLTRPGGEKRQIVAVFTDGDSDNLMVGRNGVFYDRRGRDWDATISKIVANPISIRQGFWSPYKKAARLIEDQIAKRAAALDAASQQKIAAQAQNVAELDKKPPAPPPPNKIDPGMLAAIGLVLTTLLGAVGTFVAAIFNKPMWEIPFIMLGIMLMISVPSMFMAFLKLRKRNLGPLLDANGWAINNVAKMNIPFGRSLTDMPALPPGSQRSLQDPFAEKKKPWWLYVIFGVVVALAVAFFVFVWPNRQELLNKYRPLPTYNDPLPDGKMPVRPAKAIGSSTAAAGSAKATGSGTAAPAGTTK